MLVHFIHFYSAHFRSVSLVVLDCYNTIKATIVMLVVMMIWEFKGEETVESNYESAQTKPTCGHLSHF